MFLGGVSTVPGALARRGPSMAERIERWSALREHARLLREAVSLVDGALGAFDTREAVEKTGQRPAVLDSSVFSFGAPTVSRVVSTEELNTTATSYTPYAPAWQGSSAAAVTLEGTYAGSADDTLTFRVTQRNLLGLTSFRIGVFDGSGQQTDTLQFASLSGTKTFTLGNGLTVNVGAGNVALNDELTVDVSASQGTDVKRAAALGGTGADRADLEPGLSVVNGSFTVNGEVITVSTTDTLDDVLARITASAADVTATYDDDTDTIELVRTTAGALDIELADDTSGFLAAAKLTGAVVVQGDRDEFAAPLATLAAFTGVGSGNLWVDGTAVAVDVAVDSLQDVLDRITTLTTATATWDAGAGRVRLTPDAPAGTVVLGADQTGLVAALGLRPATAFTVVEYGGLRQQAREDVVEALGAVAQRLASIRAVATGTNRSTAAGTLVSAHGSLVASMVDEHRDVLRRLALPGVASYESSATDEGVRRTVALQQSSDGFAAVLRGSRHATDDGYLDRVRELFRRAADHLEVEAESVW